MTRPLIGLSSYHAAVDRGVWVAQDSAYLTYSYVAKVAAAGGIPLLIPPIDDADEEWARAVLETLDGLLLTGGDDVAAARYGQDPHPAAQEPSSQRDECELLLARVSRDLDLPVLGICRGIQVMAVAAGGTLIQHLPDDYSRVDHPSGGGVFGSHPVQILPGSVLHDLLGDRFEVPTYHHQAVREAPGYEIAARADDGVIEAMVDPGARWRIGVQWHPEEASDLRIFEAFVAAATGNRATG
ncbi:gamma-glutamyl-gamma-aminobutyrate hydrolase family protein [Branchiibius sp. NY16-3462-2]|uniref:gamma-glutamyl-gamma-aminobutyrate hydrolase family protein n=1 Tax=Branchiibius sp. NY16-3462-2 TaxID=1807500 RepID=UPI000795128C|nr:gamma-glutamyl-gamma-aminobutyrate hydrolase family protein [Branchiibius sp. NY16-3462-2]KYH45358.1 hypothetical protein AZH51_05660 [Branchiibius sp. NY16-3462-2]